MGIIQKHVKMIQPLPIIACMACIVLSGDSSLTERRVRQIIPQQLQSGFASAQVPGAIGAIGSPIGGIGNLPENTLLPQAQFQPQFALNGNPAFLQQSFLPAADSNQDGIDRSHFGTFRQNGLLQLDDEGERFYSVPLGAQVNRFGLPLGAIATPQLTQTIIGMQRNPNLYAQSLKAGRLNPQVYQLAGLQWPFGKRR